MRIFTAKPAWLQVHRSSRSASLPAGNESHFSVGNPVYNLGFTLTPGLNPNIWLNIDVWSNQWNLPIFSPQLAVDLAANGRR